MFSLNMYALFYRARFRAACTIYLEVRHVISVNSTACVEMKCAQFLPLHRRKLR